VGNRDERRAASAQPLLIWSTSRMGSPSISRDDVEHAKPNPDLWLAAAVRLGVPPESAIAVGDSVWDLLAARGRTHSASAS
jgi:beta-phosphoglucomutase-like phosphatase (HAD superfamily)